MQAIPPPFPPKCGANERLFGRSALPFGREKAPLDTTLLPDVAITGPSALKDPTAPARLRRLDFFSERGDGALSIERCHRRKRAMRPPALDDEIRV